MVDGRDVGPTPVEVRVEPGVHEIAWDRDGFGRRTRRVDLPAGGSLTVETVLIARDAEDPAALAALGERLEIAMATFDEPSRHRGGGYPAVRPLFPRGAVRATDLSRFRIDFADTMIDFEGTVRFQRGDERLAEVGIDVLEMSHTAPIPGAVRDAVAAGDVVTWGFYPKRGEPFVATFRVVADPAADRLAAIEEQLDAQPGLLKRHFRAQLLFEAGLVFAAYTEAESILAERPESPRGLAIAMAALSAMGLSDSEPFADLQLRFDRLPEERRAGLFR
jgi:hypothetical protein